MISPNREIKSFFTGILLAAVFFLLISAAPSQPTITEYRTNSFQDEENLERWVQDNIKQGWQPIGGTTTCYVRYSDDKWGLVHSQAMVR